MKVSFNKKVNSESKDGIKIPYAPAKRTFPQIKWYLVIFIVFMPFAYMLIQIGYPLLFTNSQGILMMKRFPITAPQTGTIMEILRNVGDAVKEGDVVFAFESDRYRERRDRLIVLTAERDAILSQKDIAPRRAVTGGFDEARKNAQKQEENLRNVMALFVRGAATRAELNTAEEANKSAQAALFRISNAPALDNSEYLNTRNRDIARLNAEIKMLAGLLQTTQIKSPALGEILEISVAEQNTVMQGSVIAVVGDPKQMEILAFVDVKDFRFVVPGREADVFFADNTSVKARVLPLPSYDEPTVESTALTGNKQVIRVKLEPAEAIREENLTDGVPVKIYWGNRLVWR